MNRIFSSPIPLPIASAFAGFILSYVFPGRLSPITWTFVGFLVGSLLARIEDWWVTSTQIEARHLLEAETALLEKRRLLSEASTSSSNA